MSIRSPAILCKMERVRFSFILALLLVDEGNGTEARKGGGGRI